MIKGTCVSNRDEFRQSFYWPTVFVAVPRKGERVTNENGDIIMVVHSVTHKIRTVADTPGGQGQHKEPYIEIYLEKMC